MADDTFTLVQISDLHINPTDEVQRSRLDTILQAVLAAKPHLIVVSGDVSDDGFKNTNHLHQVKQLLGDFGVPVLVIPGNHDIGDKAGEQFELKPEYLRTWKSVFESDRFCETRNNWKLIGINTQILGSGLHEEADQFDWLDKILADAERQRHHVAFFLHAAAYLFEPNEVLSGPSQYWGFNPFPRRELLKRIMRPNIKLVANGHLHWHHVFNRNGTFYVWCPSTYLVVDDAIFPRGGDVIGFIRYQFRPSGVEPQLVKLELPAQRIQVFRHQVELPGQDPIVLAELALDFTGTLSKDGQLLPNVTERLTELAKRIRITVMTADTFGSAAQALEGLPVDVQVVASGREKAALVDKLGPQSLVAIGNGKNDAAMLKAAAIGIAVIGPEGCHGELLREADIVVNNIEDALDLLENPLRLKATLRD